MGKDFVFDGDDFVLRRISHSSDEELDTLRTRLATVEAERDKLFADVAQWHACADILQAERDAARAELAEAVKAIQATPHELTNCATFVRNPDAERLEPTYTTTVKAWREQVAALKAAQSGEARAVEALGKILVGGNHLASALIGLFNGPLPPYETDFKEARRAFVRSDEYDLWVYWAVLMRVRDSLSDLKPALSWLAQREAEAARAELDQLPGRFELGPYDDSASGLWRCIDERIKELDALRAGATGGKDA